MKPFPFCELEVNFYAPPEITAHISTIMANIHL